MYSRLATISEGGEGLMLRSPNSNYTVGRTSHLLKVKVLHQYLVSKLQPLYTEKVIVKEVEEIKKVEGGSHKFCHVKVMK